MKKLILVLGALLLLSACNNVTLPDEDAKIAAFIGESLCMSNDMRQAISSLSQEGGTLDQAKLEELQTKYQAKQADMEARGKALGLDDEAKIEALSQKYANNIALRDLFMEMVVASAQEECNLDPNSDLVTNFKDALTKGNI